MSWIDNNSNIIPSWNLLNNNYPTVTLNRTYIEGFLDVSGGNILLRNGGLFTQTDISSNGNLYIDNIYVKGNVGIGTLTPSYSLDVNGNFNVSENSIFNGNVAIGTLTASYSLDVNGNCNINGYLLQKSIFFISNTVYDISGYPISVYQPFSYANTLIYQNLGGYSPSLYGFQTVAVGNMPAGAFIAPITGLYSFYLNFREIANTSSSTFFPIINNNGAVNRFVESNLKYSDPSNNRGVQDSIIVQLTQGEGFYYAGDAVGNNFNYCYFSGKLESIF